MITKDYFIIPYGDEKFAYVYFPIKGAFFRCEYSLADEIISYCQSGRIKDEYISLKNRIDDILAKPDLMLHNNDTAFPGFACFLLSEKCNLACTYCYAHDSHCQSELTIDNLRAYLDYFFSFRKKQRGISFLGGGEPLLTWALIEDAVNYAKQKAKENNEQVRFGITTNLTILSPKILEFIKVNNIVVNVSFDVLPEIQDKQRIFPNGCGTFAIVDKNLKLLLDNGIVPRIRATITSLNVNKMPDMVQFIVDNYPQIKTIHFEHVSDIDEMERKEYISDFVKNYFVAMKIARKFNKRLTNSAISSVRNIKNNFCSKEFCITANNEIVSCHRVSNGLNENPFKYGKLNGNTIEFCNDTQEESLLPPKNCDKCFAKYNCAGGCRYNRFMLNTTQFNNYCDFIRKMLIGFFGFLLDNDTK